MRIILSDPYTSGSACHIFLFSWTLKSTWGWAGRRSVVTGTAKKNWSCTCSRFLVNWTFKENFGSLFESSHGPLMTKSVKGLDDRTGVVQAMNPSLMNSKNHLHHPTPTPPGVSDHTQWLILQPTFFFTSKLCPSHRLISAQQRILQTLSPLIFFPPLQVYQRTAANPSAHAGQRG